MRRCQNCGYFQSTVDRHIKQISCDMAFLSTKCNVWLQMHSAQCGSNCISSLVFVAGHFGSILGDFLALVERHFARVRWKFWLQSSLMMIADLQTLFLINGRLGLWGKQIQFKCIVIVCCQRTLAKNVDMLKCTQITKFELSVCISVCVHDQVYISSGYWKQLTTNVCRPCNFLPVPKPQLIARINGLLMFILDGLRGLCGTAYTVTHSSIILFMTRYAPVHRCANASSTPNPQGTITNMR